MRSTHAALIVGLVVAVSVASDATAQSSTYSLSLSLGDTDAAPIAGQVPIGSGFAAFSVAPSVTNEHPFAMIEETVTFAAEGFIANHENGLKVTLTQDGADIGTHVRANFQWTTTDTWSLVARSALSVLPDLALNGNFVVQVQADAENEANYFDGYDFGNTAPFSYSAFAGFAIRDVTIGPNFMTQGTTNLENVNRALGVQWSAPGQANGQFSIVLRSVWSLDAIEEHRTIIDGTNTFVLKSVTFEDGSTPEDHGFDLVFGSGRTSPNIIPEPGMVTMASIACLGVALRGRRFPVMTP